MPKVRQPSNRRAVTKETVSQRYLGTSAPATGAILFACLLGVVTAVLNSDEVGPWIAVSGLFLTLATLASAYQPVRDLMLPIFLGLGALGLMLFSGDPNGISASAMLWPILGMTALGSDQISTLKSRISNGVGASFCVIISFVVISSLVILPTSSMLGLHSGILAIAVNGALALAACIQMGRGPTNLATGTQAQIQAATNSRDAALAEARQAQAQTRARAQFMAEMSHEIRTPLNAILGFADTMREGVFGPLPSAYGDYPDLIHTSGTHLLDLVSDLLDLSKIEAGRYETTLKPLRLDDVAYEGVRLSSGAASSAGVQIRHEASAPIEITGDARALRQIVFNLISNAIKFTPHGGRVNVRVIIHHESGTASLEVEDTGVGIGPADLARIGQPWNQSRQDAPQDAKRSRGSGLGLALVKRLTELQGGQFNLASTLGSGTRARVTFSIAQPMNSTPRPPA